MRSLLLAVLLCLWAAAPLRAAEQIAVRAGVHDGYGRIVFDWPRRVGYQAFIDKGRLVVRFDRPASFAGPVMDRGLRGYAAPAQAIDDGHGLTLPLEGKYDLKHFRLGSKVVVDLRQQAAVPDQKNAAKQAADAKPDPGLPKVRVRGGRHEGFSRLVVDWNAPVGNVLEQAPGRARLVFDRPAAFDTAPVHPELLPQVDGITADRDSLTVKVPAGSRLKVSRSGPKVIIDIYAKTPAPAAAKKPAEAVPKPRAAENPSPRPDAPAPAKSASTAEPAKPAGGAAEAPTSLVPKSMGGEAAPAPPATPPAAKAQKSGPAVSDAQRARFTVATEPEPSFLKSDAQGPRADPAIPVVMTFAWNGPTAAAAFRRGDNLWLVFDGPAPKDMVHRIAAAAPHLGQVQLLDDGGATILLIRAAPTIVPRLKRDGNIWTVDLRPRSPLPEHSLAPPVVEDQPGPRVRYPIIGAGRILWVTDPDLGDRLAVVPTRGAGMGLALPYSFPQFRSQPTQQGIVLQPLTPGFEVATIRTGVLVRDRDGLLVSRPEDRRDAKRAADPLATMPRLFDLEAWRRGGTDKFQKNRQALLQAMNGLKGERLGVARLDLARFFFAHGFDSETLGTVQLIEQENPRLAQDPELLLMKGASQVMLEDYRGAAVSLAHPALAGEREAMLWQALLAARAEDWQAAATGFSATLDLIDAYPRNVWLPLGLAAAESFLHTGDLKAATLQLGAMLRKNLDDSELAQVKVVQGELELAKGDPEQAGRLWAEARDGPYRPAQAQARLALIDLGLKQGTLKPDAAIAELERLRFAWRGDDFEFTLMRKLADLYAQQKRYRDALYILREAVTNFPDGPSVRNAAQRMREIFADIFKGPGDPGVPPLRALALYQEFMELTPAGAAGDRMIAGLADRLVEVDLLDRAAELLEGQVRYRLEGLEKAKVGTRLALVDLLNHKPEATLEALDISKVDGIAGDLAEQRLQLHARALSQLDRSDEALQLLAHDDSLNAERLRAEIYWHRQQWPEAATSLAKLVPLLPPQRPMTQEESRQVVNLAVALLLSNKKPELEDLNRRYGAAMAKGPQADTFKLLVGDDGNTAVTTIADELNKVKEVQDFMASYRAQVKADGLSKVN